ncbi:MAG: site-specific integrase [Prolixibacteraceae bacterium]|jgi:site-specific recombinase XerD|nr:site-specific integrase [Prolixibacteraceae bacterium]
MKAAYRIIFNRRNKLDKKGEASVNIEVRFQNHSRKIVGIGIKIRPEHWDDKKSCISKTHPNAIKLNKLLRDKILEIENYELELLDRGGYLSANKIDALLFYGKRNKFMDFTEFCNNTNEKDQSITFGTFKARRTGINNIKRFGKINSWTEITLKTILEFDNFLHKQGYKQTTIGKQHSYLKLFINIAIKEGYLHPNENPYNHFKIRKKNHNEIPRYIKPDEIEKIKKVKLLYETGELSKDLFLFSCYTGIAYSDVMSLSRKNISDINDRPVIKKKRQKTKEEFIVPLLPLPLQIIKKYKDSKRETLFPTISNQKYNQNLKRIANTAGIQDRLTTHVARHTFASIFLNSGGRIEVLQRILGHSDINSTQIYAKIFDETVIEEMNAIS